MHEMGICSSILNASFEAAENAGATKIDTITITIGDLTEIQEFALQFAWEALTPGTMAEGGTLVVNHLTPISRCTECGAEYEHDRFTMLCPECGSMAVQLIQGRELQIDSIETDDGEALPEEEATDADPAPDTDSAGKE